MNSNKKTTDKEMKAKLSALWIFVLLNVIFRDIHELFRQGFIEEIITGTVNGVQLTEELMLMAGIQMEILIVMPLLSVVLKYKANRWTNIIVGMIAIAFVILNGVRDLDDIFFLIVEILAISTIIWFAWRWPNPELSPNNSI